MYVWQFSLWKVFNIMNFFYPKLVYHVFTWNYICFPQFTFLKFTNVHEFSFKRMKFEWLACIKDWSRTNKKYSKLVFHVLSLSISKTLCQTLEGNHITFLAEIIHWSTDYKFAVIPVFYETSQKISHFH